MKALLFILRILDMTNNYIHIFVFCRKLEASINVKEYSLLIMVCYSGYQFKVSNYLSG